MVVVTAKSLEDELPQQLSEYGAHLDTVTAAQIQNGGYIDVAGASEALAPALYVSSKNGPFDYAQISLQGSRSEDVLYGCGFRRKSFPGWRSPPAHRPPFHD